MNDYRIKQIIREVLEEGFKKLDPKERERINAEYKAKRDARIREKNNRIKKMAMHRLERDYKSGRSLSLDGSDMSIIIKIISSIANGVLPQDIEITNDDIDKLLKYGLITPYDVSKVLR